MDTKIQRISLARWAFRIMSLAQAQLPQKQEQSGEEDAKMCNVQ